MQLLEQGAYGRALAAASAVTKLPGAETLDTGLATLRLICRLHLAGPTATCWQVHTSARVIAQLLLHNCFHSPG